MHFQTEQDPSWAVRNYYHYLHIYTIYLTFCLKGQLFRISLHISMFMLSKKLYQIIFYRKPVLILLHVQFASVNKT